MLLACVLRSEKTDRELIVPAIAAQPQTFVLTLKNTVFHKCFFFFFVRAAFRASAAFPEFSFLTREDRALAAWSNTENTHLHRLVNSMVMKSQCNSMQLIAEWNSAPTFGLCVHFLSHIFPVRSSSSLQFMNLILHVICTVPCFLLGIF